MSKKPEPEFHVGQRIRINAHRGRIEDATVKAVVEHTDGLRLQVDFGHEQEEALGSIPETLQLVLQHLRTS